MLALVSVLKEGFDSAFFCLIVLRALLSLRSLFTLVTLFVITALARCACFDITFALRSLFALVYVPCPLLALCTLFPGSVPCVWRKKQPNVVCLRVTVDGAFDILYLECL